MLINETLKQVLYEHLYHTKNCNIEGVLKTVHQSSPAYSQTKQALENLFSHFEINTEILEFNYIGKDENFAYGRAKQKITKISGPEFVDCINDQIFIFKLQNKKWKIWTLAALETKPII